MTGREAPEIIQCGRRISSEEVERIRETVGDVSRFVPQGAGGHDL